MSNFLFKKYVLSLSLFLSAVSMDFCTVQAVKNNKKNNENNKKIEKEIEEKQTSNKSEKIENASEYGKICKLATKLTNNNFFNTITKTIDFLYNKNKNDKLLEACSAILSHIGKISSNNYDQINQIIKLLDKNQATRNAAIKILQIAENLEIEDNNENDDNNENNDNNIVKIELKENHLKFFKNKKEKENKQKEVDCKNQILSFTQSNKTQLQNIQVFCNGEINDNNTSNSNRNKYSKQKNSVEKQLRILNGNTNNEILNKNEKDLLKTAIEEILGDEIFPNATITINSNANINIAPPAQLSTIEPLFRLMNENLYEIVGSDGKHNEVIEKFTLSMPEVLELVTLQTPTLTTPNPQPVWLLRKKHIFSFEWDLKNNFEIEGFHIFQKGFHDYGTSKNGTKIGYVKGVVTSNEEEIEEEFDIKPTHKFKISTVFPTKEITEELIYFYLEEIQKDLYQKTIVDNIIDTENHKNDSLGYKKGYEKCLVFTNKTKKENTNTEKFYFTAFLRKLPVLINEKKQEIVDQFNTIHSFFPAFVIPGVKVIIEDDFVYFKFSNKREKQNIDMTKRFLDKLTSDNFDKHSANQDEATIKSNVESTQIELETNRISSNPKQDNIINPNLKIINPNLKNKNSTQRLLSYIMEKLTLNTGNYKIKSDSPNLTWVINLGESVNEIQASGRNELLLDLGLRKIRILDYRKNRPQHPLL